MIHMSHMLGIYRQSCIVIGNHSKAPLLFSAVMWPPLSEPNRFRGKSSGSSNSGINERIGRFSSVLFFSLLFRIDSYFCPLFGLSTVLYIIARSMGRAFKSLNRLARKSSPPSPGACTVMGKIINLNSFSVHTRLVCLCCELFYRAADT